MDSLSSAEGVRNSLQDCGVSTSDEQNRQLVSTHFLEFREQGVAAHGDGSTVTTTACDEYGTVHSGGFPLGLGFYGFKSIFRAGVREGA